MRIFDHTQSYEPNGECLCIWNYRRIGLVHQYISIICFSTRGLQLPNTLTAFICREKLHNGVVQLHWQQAPLEP